MSQTTTISMFTCLLISALDVTELFCELYHCMIWRSSLQLDGYSAPGKVGLHECGRQELVPSDGVQKMATRVTKHATFRVRDGRSSTWSATAWRLGNWVSRASPYTQDP